VRFASVSPEDARDEYRRAEAALDDLESSRPPDGDLGWTGSLE
jgi:hypothetical protein